MIFQTLTGRSCIINLDINYLISLCEYPEQKANDSRVKHGVSVETQPGKIHADLHSKVVTDIIYKADEILRL